MLDESPPYKKIALFFSFFSFFIFSYQLEQISLYHTDEQYYIQSCRNIVESGDWLTPEFNGEKRFAKPILFYWLVSSSYKIFGATLSSARLISALLGSLCLWLTFRMGSVLFDHRTGLYSTFILGSSYLYFLSARLAYTDMTLCFFVTLSLFFFSKSITRHGRELEVEAGSPSEKRNIFLFYLFAGLATATKGPPGFLIPGLTAGIFLILTRDRETTQRFFHLPGIFLFLFLSLFWPIAMVWLHGSSFTNHLLHAEGIDRVLHSEKLDFYFFFVIIRYFAPWSIFLIAVVIITFRKGRTLLESQEKPRLFLWIYFVVPVILFVLLRIQHSRYPLPVFPALAIIVGDYFNRIVSRKIDPASNSFRFSFLCTAFLYFVISATILAAGGLLYYFNWEEFSFSIFFLPVVFIAGLALMVISWRKKDFAFLPIIISFPLIVSFPLLPGKILPSLNPEPLMGFTEKIHSHWKPGTQLATYQLGNGNQRLRVLTGWPVTYLERRKDLLSFLNNKSPFFLVIHKDAFEDMKESLGKELQVISEAKKWKKIKLDEHTIDHIKEEFGPKLLEEFREKVLLIYKGKA